MLSLEQIKTLTKGLKVWTLDQLKENQSKISLLENNFNTFKDEVEDTIQNLPDESAPKAMMVYIDQDTGKATHTAEQISNHVQNGGSVVFLFLYITLQLTALIEGLAIFSGVVEED